MGQALYFVWHKSDAGQVFRVARREVKARTLKGYPISFVLKLIPRDFDCWEKAQALADHLNREQPEFRGGEWPELEIQALD